MLGEWFYCVTRMHSAARCLSVTRRYWV